MTDKIALIYGSLYLDEGESWDFAERQVDECILKILDTYPLPRIGLAFDVVATPAQIAKGEARRLLAGGGVNLNEERVTDLQRAVGAADLRADGTLLLRTGKRNYHLVRVE